MGDALQSLEDQYIFMTNHLNDYIGACQSPAQKETVTTNYVDCRRNYWDCVNQTFHNDDPRIVAAVKDMGTAQDTLEDSLKKLNDIASVLNVITKAVQVGAKLASMVG